MLALAKYSVGVGDRFAHQAKAQLRACIMAAEQGAEVIPVWNKSHREHTTIGSEPPSVRTAADAAVKVLGWTKPYHVDADHIRLETVDGFLASSDFYTIDVADAIGRPARRGRGESVRRPPCRTDRPARDSGIEEPLPTTRADVERTAGKFLLAVQEAGRIYRHIASAKGAGTFITEVSMDETDSPQTPPELLVILAAIADEGIPIQTIAPKFTGRFNKGVDYVGDVPQFEKEFRAGPRGDRLRREEVRPAGQPEAERPFRQRQVFAVRPDAAGAGAQSGPACTSRRPARPGWKR